MAAGAGILMRLVSSSGSPPVRTERGWRLIHHGVFPHTSGKNDSAGAGGERCSHKATAILLVPKWPGS